MTPDEVLESAFATLVKQHGLDEHVTQHQAIALYGMCHREITREFETGENFLVTSPGQQAVLDFYTRERAKDGSQIMAQVDSLATSIDIGQLKGVQFTIAMWDVVRGCRIAGHLAKLDGIANYYAERWGTLQDGTFSIDAHANSLSRTSETRSPPRGVEDDKESSARRQLWDAGYMLSPGIGRDWLLLDSRHSKVAVAIHRTQDDRWNVRRIRGCLAGPLAALASPSDVADGPCSGFVKLLALDRTTDRGKVASPQGAADAADRDSTSEQQDIEAATRLSKLGYRLVECPRPGIEPMVVLVLADEKLAFAEPLPDGRWRAKRRGFMRAMLGNRNAVYDSSPAAAFCRLLRMAL